MDDSTAKPSALPVTRDSTTGRVAGFIEFENILPITHGRVRGRARLFRASRRPGDDRFTNTIHEAYWQ